MSICRLCLLGNRLLAEEGSGNCTKEEGSPMWNMYCKYVDVAVESFGGQNRTVKMPQCDPYFESHNATRVQGLPGLGSGIFLGNTILCFFTMFFYLNCSQFEENLGGWHLDLGQLIGTTLNPVDIEVLDQPVYNQVVADITTTFTLLVGIYFPSVTGRLSIVC